MWTIFNSSVLKDIINDFLLYHSFKLTWSATSRQPTAKPSCDSSATSAIVLNFGRGELAERLQCMSN